MGTVLGPVSNRARVTTLSCHPERVNPVCPANACDQKGLFHGDTKLIRTTRLLLVTCLLIPILSGCSGGQLVDTLRAQLQSPAARYEAEGDRLSADGRAAEAILSYRQAVTQDERNVMALRKLARVYATQGRRRLAQYCLQRAAALAPADTGLAQELTALDVKPGDSTRLKLLWQVETPGGLPTGMTMAGTVLYVAFEDGRVKAMAAATGAPAWEIKLPTRITSAPAAGEGLVFVGGEDGALYALDAADGRKRWELATSAPIYAAPALAGDMIYCPSGDGSLYAASLADGKMRWQIAAVRPLTGSPTVAEGVLYFGDAAGRIWAVDAVTGAERWGPGVLAQGPVESQPTVAGGRVFVGAGDSRLYVLAVASGGEYWRYSSADAIYARPIVISDTVYLASAGRTLTALDVMTGDERWDVRAPSPVPYSPAVVGTTVYYVAAGDPNLYAVDAATGKPLWQMDTGDWLAGGPVIADGTLYLLGKDGAVLALKPVS